MIQRRPVKTLRARVLGYCMGVRRAVELAVAETAQAGMGPGAAAVYTMGPLIHNPQVLRDLERRGVSILDEEDLPPELNGARVIIRAHGITPALREELLRRGASLTDATCPRVRASQMKARTLSAEGYTVFLAGERRHGEVAGILGYAPGCIVAANREEAEAAAAALIGKAGEGLKTALLAQTTLSPEEFRDIAGGITALLPDTLLVNTICEATRERQDSLRELCEKVDAAVIVGGLASANTRRLRAVAEDCGKPAWLVEGPGDLPPELAAYGVVGLSAGASTPEAAVDAVERALLRGGGC
jgi:4-hydroxy-3-methylbut-2-enyl diphosphate reductase